MIVCTSFEHSFQCSSWEETSRSRFQLRTRSMLSTDISALITLLFQEVFESSILPVRWFTSLWKIFYEFARRYQWQLSNGSCRICVSGINHLILLKHHFITILKILISFIAWRFVWWHVLWYLILRIFGMIQLRWHVFLVFIILRNLMIFVWPF